jgi:polyisoprenoid-binding protein YceI
MVKDTHFRGKTMNTRRARTLLIPVFLCGALVARADAPAFAPVAAQSSLSFAATQQGEKFTGAFRDFDAHIAYAPDQLPRSRIDATIRMKSLDSKNQERDSALVGSDWFDVAKFPTATFRTTAIRATPTGAVGDADLTIKGKTKRIAFPFTWRTDAGKVVLDARVTIDRLDFGVGTGDWADESIVGHKVGVNVHLVLAPAAAAASPPPPAPPPSRKP